MGPCTGFITEISYEEFHTVGFSIVRFWTLALVFLEYLCKVLCCFSSPLVMVLVIYHNNVCFVSSLWIPSLTLSTWKLIISLVLSVLMEVGVGIYLVTNRLRNLLDKVVTKPLQKNGLEACRLV
jgi:hypothetical protein